MDFLGIGGWEIFMVILIALILFGPGRIVEIARALGKIVHKARNITSDLTAQIAKEVDEQKRSEDAKGREDGQGKDTL
jgi:sec-independent protein translocase protein TatA